MTSLIAQWRRKHLKFKRLAGTSRGVLNAKLCWYLLIKDQQTNALKAVGECAPLRGLSIDDFSRFETVLDELCQNFGQRKKDYLKTLSRYPSIQFGLESALQDLRHPDDGLLFPSGFTDGQDNIPVNGLVWMGCIDFMHAQIRKQLHRKCQCLKIKIGALDFEDECRLIKSLRSDFAPDTLEIRVDANGAFAPQTALKKLDTLAGFHLHSIEQPILAGQWEEMAELCRNTPLPIALDEELIGICGYREKVTLLSQIKPQYIILKPSLLGGFSQCREWIDIAENHGIGWWITSALESNIGLNAIAQWTATHKITRHQGLGTGTLYTNNIVSPLRLHNNALGYDAASGWDYRQLFPLD